MDDRPIDAMNMVPFIDIMLVLLTIVLTTSSFIASGRIPVHLPQAQAALPDRDRSRRIEIDAQGSIFLDGHGITPQALRGALSALPKDTPILLRADRDVRLQRFVEVADVLQQLGFTRVAMQTRQSG